MAEMDEVQQRYAVSAKVETTGAGTTVYYPEYEPQTPVLPKRSQRYLGFVLKPVILPVVVVGLGGWPVVALLCAVPVVGVMAIPILLLMSVCLLYAVAWTSYLLLAQKDLPAAWSHARSWSPRNFAPFVPISPVRCAKVDLAALRYTLTAVGIVFPAIFDWSYRRIMVIGTTKGSRVVKEGILYGSPSRGKRLDVYLPADASGVPRSSGGNGVPVVVVIPSMIAPLTITSKRRLYLQLALRLRRMGYCVIVADITYYPESRVKSSIVDLRLVLRWTGQNCQRYGGDASKIHVMGHGLSAHLIMLTLAQEAVVLSREAHLDGAYERQRQLLRSTSRRAGSSGSASGSGTSEEEDEWLKSGEVGTAAAATSPQHHQDPDVSTVDDRAGGDGWVDDDADPLVDPTSAPPPPPPGFVMGATRPFPHSTAEPPTTTARSSRRAEEAEAILSSTLYRKASDEVGNGLKRVEIYEPGIVLPPIAGVVLLSGISDVIKGFRSESERGLEHLSYLRRATGPSHFNCLVHSPAHLLYAAKNIFHPSLLPPKFLLVHGGKDTVVPVEQSTLLKTLLVGIGVHNVRLRAYRNLAHAEAVACLFLGMGARNTRYTRQISEDIASFIGQ